VAETTLLFNTAIVLSLISAFADSITNVSPPLSTMVPSKSRDVMQILKTNIHQRFEDDCPEISSKRSGVSTEKKLVMHGV